MRLIKSKPELPPVVLELTHDEAKVLEHMAFYNETIPEALEEAGAKIPGVRDILGSLLSCLQQGLR